MGIIHFLFGIKRRRRFIGYVFYRSLAEFCLMIAALSLAGIVYNKFTLLWGIFIVLMLIAISILLQLVSGYFKSKIM